MQMFVASHWKGASETMEIRNPFDQAVIDTVPLATTTDVNEALNGAVQGAKVMAELTAFDRSQILRRSADMMAERAEDCARLITAEQGKTLREARIETERSIEILQISAEEAKRLTGEVLPLNASPRATDRLGFTVACRPDALWRLERQWHG